MNFITMVTQNSTEKVLSQIRYPKLLLLLSTFVIAYFLFSGRTYLPFYDFLISLGYFGTFLSGILFAYGFTAAPATAILLILVKEQNIFLAGVIAGFGALFGDLLIFKIIRYSFADEIEKLSKERGLLFLQRKTPNFFKKYFTAIFAGFIIASPLPDEIGIALLASSKNVSTKFFSMLSYLLNTIGIFVILFIGKSLI